MIRHIVIFSWREEVSREDVAEICAQLSELPAILPELESYEFGSDLGLNDGNGDFAIIATVADERALRGYLDHPQHVQVAKRLHTMADARTAVQIEFAGG